MTVEHDANFEFSPDSQLLAVAHPDRTLGLYDPASGRQVRVLDAKLDALPAGMAFHLTKPRLALTCPTGAQVRDLETGKLVAHLRQDTPATGLAWHPDGRTLAAVGRDSKIYLWDVRGRKTIHVTSGDASGGTQVAASPAGDLLAGNGWDSMLRLWDLRTGRPLFKTRSAGYNLGFSRDGWRLAPSTDGTRLLVWEIVPSRCYRTLVAPLPSWGQLAGPASFHPAGLLAVPTADSVGLWDSVRGAELGLVPSGPTVWALFEPSGALLTAGLRELQRWPVRAEAGWTLHLGPPEILPLPGPFVYPANQLACSRFAAVAGGDAVLALPGAANLAGKP